MHFEVELKFPVADLAALTTQLVARGARLDAPVEQRDRYFAHPCRDFARTDEALRIRQIGLRCVVTYKGPKIDAATKTRREIELPLGDATESFVPWTTLLESLGFQIVAEVRKLRQGAHLVWQDADVEIALDRVDRVGTFVEFELTADAAGLEAARSRILSLAAALGLAGGERRSYLELLAEKAEEQALSRKDWPFGSQLDVDQLAEPPPPAPPP
jgi:adenylate cyclase, class 2